MAGVCFWQYWQNTESISTRMSLEGTWDKEKGFGFG